MQVKSPIGFSAFCMAAVMLGFMLIGCAAQKPNLNQQLVREVDGSRCPRVVAVLPFENQTKEEGLEEFVRISFYGHLSALAYRDVELTTVDRKLEQWRSENDMDLAEIPIARLGRLLQCDAVIFGKVIEYRELFAGIYSQMSVGAEITMWDTRTGSEIWSDRFITRHHEGGIPLTFVDLPLITIRSGWNLREDEKAEIIDELARKLVARMPAPVGLLDAEPREASNAEETAPDAGSHSYSKYKSLKRLTRRSTPQVYSANKFQSMKKLTYSPSVSPYPTVFLER